VTACRTAAGGAGSEDDATGTHVEPLPCPVVVAAVARALEPPGGEGAGLEAPALSQEGGLPKAVAVAFSSDALGTVRELTPDTEVAVANADAGPSRGDPTALVEEPVTVLLASSRAFASWHSDVTIRCSHTCSWP